MKNSLLFISEHGNSAPIVWRLLQEGVRAELYVHSPSYRPIYTNMLPRLRLDALEEALKRCDRVFIDMVTPNHQNPEDIALLKKFDISLDAPGVFGALGDKLKRSPYNKDVTGGGVKPEKWELDREAGIKLARQIGLKIPEYHAFGSFKDGAKFVYSGPGKGRRWVIKPCGNKTPEFTYAETFKKGGEVLDLLSHTYPARFGTDKVDFILQAFVENAVELSSELWIHDSKIVSANRTFENKKLGSGDTGPAIGSQSNTVWICKDANGIVHKQMQNLLPLVQGLNGAVDANCMIDKAGDAWFLEWTMFRFGLDALYLLLSLIPKGKLATFWLKGFQAKFKKGFAASQRLSLYPCPRVKTEADRKEIRGNLINHSLKDLDNWWLQDVMMDSDDKLRVAGADGLVGVNVCLGDTMEEAINSCQKECQNLEVSGNKQFRTDHLEKHSERMDKLKKFDVNVF